MKSIKIFKEEINTNLKEIEKAEQIWKTQFPSDYKDFLLEYNGGVPYPNYPTISSENNSELWPINRFFSIGDVVIQKKYPMTYTLHNIEEENFERLNLNKDYLLVFALGDRGEYIMNLYSEDFGQIYFANFSGGDGIIKVNTNSFSEFFGSLDMSKWSDEEYDPDFKMTKLYYSNNKIFQDYLFHTPKNPLIGFNRFKEVFVVLGDIQPIEDGYPSIPQKYVHDKLKLEYLLEKGCSSDGLLCYAKSVDIIKYLLKERGLDINKIYKGRYPLQNYLTPTNKNEIKKKYELIHELLESGIEMDWSIRGTKSDGSSDLSMIDKLKVLRDEYLQYEIDDRNWWIKNGKPSGHIPFKRRTLIEQKLGIADSKG